MIINPTLHRWQAHLLRRLEFQLATAAPDNDHLRDRGPTDAGRAVEPLVDLRVGSQAAA